jgi:hypothetical protein
MAADTHMFRARDRLGGSQEVERAANAREHRGPHPDISLPDNRASYQEWHRARSFDAPADRRIVTMHCTNCPRIHEFVVRAGSFVSPFDRLVCGGALAT